jgi:hypothetical protein
LLCSSGAVIFEAHLERAGFEPGANRAVPGERGREDDSPLLAARADDQLLPDLAEIELGTIGEGDRDRQHRAAVLGADPLGQLGVHDPFRALLREQLGAEPVEHLRPDDLLGEVAGERQRHR